MSTSGIQTASVSTFVTIASVLAPSLCKTSTQSLKSIRSRSRAVSASGRQSQESKLHRYPSVPGREQQSERIIAASQRLSIPCSWEPSASTIPCRLPSPSAWKEKGEHCSPQLVAGKVVGPCRKRRHQTPTRQSPSRASPLFGIKRQGTHLVSCRRLARGNQAHRPLHVASLLLERRTINCPPSKAGREKQGSKPPCRKRRHLTPTRQSPSEHCTPQLVAGDVIGWKHAANDRI